jgi:hypothetical protein
MLVRVLRSVCKRTNVGLAKETAGLCRRRWRRRVLDLRRRWGARLAHGVRSVHDERLGT